VFCLQAARTQTRMGTSNLRGAVPVGYHAFVSTKPASRGVTVPIPVISYRPVSSSRGGPGDSLELATRQARRALASADRAIARVSRTWRLA
jgi:hypothetical protein